MVLRVVINTDKYKYPIGSGRVTFAEEMNYKRAVDSKFLEIRTSKFMKKIQIDPFMEEPPLCRACRCRSCHGSLGSPPIQHGQMSSRMRLFKPFV
uniref:Uncharacterized protein n=1 Tax=Ditylenchus dipsaci TaxID=166011 RepID=A0A915CY77_9BILA